MAITDWSEDHRPREKLLQKGQQALSEAELLVTHFPDRYHRILLHEAQQRLRH